MSDNKECVLPIEELSAMKNVGRVGSSSDDDQDTSSDDDQDTVIDDIFHDEDDVDERIRKLNDFVKGENQQTTTHAQGLRPKIQKVPFVLGDRKKFIKFYEPKVVSVGPIHHGKPNLRVAERYKSKLAVAFIKQSGCETRALYKIINDKINELKDYYHEDEHKKDDDKILSWILFLDGCAVLQFIHGFYLGKLHDFMIKTDHIAFMQHDLFLLENQIPFEVLKLLMDSSILRAELMESVGCFIHTNIMAPQKYKRKLSIDIDKLDITPIHLLDIFHQAVVLNNKKEPKIKHREWSPSTKSFLNVQELKTFGIDFNINRSFSLTDITFYTRFFTGWLYLPPILVDESTAPKFFNLIAYESCPDNFRTNYEVTSYICFLHSLIQNEEDVKDLRSAGIMRNWLHTDTQVAQMFNEIGRNALFYNEFLHDVNTKINAHCKRKCVKWVAEVYHDHFSSPWAFLALIAAVTALFLTGVQTWFAIYPRK